MSSPRRDDQDTSKTQEPAADTRAARPGSMIGEVAAGVGPPALQRRLRARAAERSLEAGAAVVQRRKDGDANASDAAKDARKAGASGEPIPPATVDKMIAGTPAIYQLVERKMSNKLKVDGNTFFYESEEAMARGLAGHMSTWYFDLNDGQVKAMSDNQVLQEARRQARGNVAVTLVDADNTIHINTRADGHSFRTILHEAMHQKMMLNLAQLGKSVNEGFAEYLSKVILDNHGVSFEVYGSYQKQFDFVVRMVGLFGEDTILRSALAGSGGEKFIREKYLEQSSRTHWNELLAALRAGDYGAANKALEWYVTLASMNRKSDEADAKNRAAGEAGYERADKDYDDAVAARERAAWPPEGSEPITARLKLYGESGGGTIVTIDKGGHDGVREGWRLQIKRKGSTLAGRSFNVTTVMNSKCRAAIDAPTEEVYRELRSEVTLRPPANRGTMKL